MSTSKSIQQSIEDFLNQNLDSPSHFLVEVGVSSGKGKESRVQVLMDSDFGITIEECAAYSRKLGKFLEESDFFEGAYNLEVASPGLDFQIESDRQFQKNLLRGFLLELDSHKVVEGKLISFSADMLEIETEEKTKGKKNVVQRVQIPRQQIVKAKVTVSFK